MIINHAAAATARAAAQKNRSEYRAALQEELRGYQTRGLKSRATAVEKLLAELPADKTAEAPDESEEIPEEAQVGQTSAAEQLAAAEEAAKTEAVKPATKPTVKK